MKEVLLMACSVLSLMCVANVLHQLSLCRFVCKTVFKQDLYLVEILLNEIMHELVLFV